MHENIETELWILALCCVVNETPAKLFADVVAALERYQPRAQA